MSDEYEDFDALMGMTPPEPDTPEIEFYRELTEEGKYKRIGNCIFWLRHELYIHVHMQQAQLNVYIPSGAGLRKATLKEVTRVLLEYYFLQHHHARFDNPRAKEMGREANIQIFLNLVLENPSIKKLIANPHELV